MSKTQFWLLMLLVSVGFGIMLFPPWIETEYYPNGAYYRPRKSEYAFGFILTGPPRDKPIELVETGQGGLRYGEPLDYNPFPNWPDPHSDINGKTLVLRFVFVAVAAFVIIISKPIASSIISYKGLFWPIPLFALIAAIGLMAIYPAWHYSGPNAQGTKVNLDYGYALFTNPPNHNSHINFSRLALQSLMAGGLIAALSIPLIIARKKQP